MFQRKIKLRLKGANWRTLRNKFKNNSESRYGYTKTRKHLETLRKTYVSGEWFLHLTCRGWRFAPLAPSVPPLVILSQTDQKWQPLHQSRNDNLILIGSSTDTHSRRESRAATGIERFCTEHRLFAARWSGFAYLWMLSSFSEPVLIYQESNIFDLLGKITLTAPFMKQLVR